MELVSKQERLFFTNTALKQDALIVLPLPAPNRGMVGLTKET